MRYLNPQGFALLVGIVAGVLARSSDPGLSGWDEFWIVVAASIFVTLVVGGGSWLWKWSRRPMIEIEGGNSDEFRYVLSKRDPRKAATLSGQIAEIYTTRLRVTETRGVQARNVQVRARRAEGELPKVLQWLNEEDVYTIEGRIPAYVRICELFEYQDGTTTWRSHHPDIGPGKRVEIEVEVVVDGSKPRRKTFHFVVDWKEGNYFAEVSGK